MSKLVTPRQAFIGGTRPVLNTWASDSRSVLAPDREPADTDQVAHSTTWSPRDGWAAGQLRRGQNW
jgi:hypothetical protein